jgi:8-oxo-dGTP pyrophosphatase MutT (NUDIX family)
MPTFATLCYLLKDDKVLLLHKANGLFGEGKWNAPGGKLLIGETPETGAAREMNEETGLSVSSLRFHGILNFYLGEAKEIDQTVFVFSSEKSSGKMRHSREGELQWFRLSEIPYGEMWKDDEIWLPFVIEGKNFIGDFNFTANYKELASYGMHEVR